MRPTEAAVPARDPEVIRGQNRVQANRATSPSMDALPEEDFSDAAIKRREMLQFQADSNAAIGWMNDANRIEQGAPMASGQVAPQTAAPDARAKAAQVLAGTLKRQGPNSLAKYPTLVKWVAEAAANGATIDEQDIVRMTNFGAADQAATMFINAKDDQRRKNILLSMTPVQRAATLDIVESKGAEFLATLETADSNWFVDTLGTVVGTALKPLEWLNDTTQHTYRALGAFGQNEGGAADQVAYGASNFLGPITQWGDMWAKTETGQFNRKYIDTLKASGQYTPLEVDLMTAIAESQARGDEDPIMSTLTRYSGIEGSETIIRKLIYGQGGDPHLDELARQIDSANNGSTGQLVFSQVLTPDTSEYSDYRGLRGREVGANSASVFYTFFLDPTIVGSKIVGAYRIGKYALSKLAPGASAADALASTRVAGKEMNAARAYVDRFTGDLRKLDGMTGVDAARHRQLMARQYKEFPPDVVEEFYKQGVRTTDDFAQFIDETNDAFLIAHGKPTGWTQQLLDGPVALNRAESPFAEVPFYERLYSAGDQGKRTPLMPRTSSSRVMRETAVRAISKTVMPEARSKAVIAQFYGEGKVDDVVQALDGSTADVTQIGRMDQRAAGTGWQGRRLDGVSRLFASLPNKQQIFTADARDAGTFYKYARSFMTKRHADFLTAAFRDANPGQRRLMVAGVIRTAAGARGVRLSKEDVLAQIDDLATGTREGELYSAGRIVETAPATGDLALDVENTVVYRPSNVNGHEHALHLWQTTEAVHIPSIREMEQLKAYRAITPDWLEAAPGVITDAWSLGTLYGLRFAMRSAVEDIWAYAATAGRLPYLYLGRRASTGLRDARPNLTIKRYKTSFGSHKKGDPILDTDGNAQIVLKSRLGMFGKRARAIGDHADNGAGLTSQIVGAFMLGNIDEARIVAAQQAAKAGEWGATRELIGEALTRQRLTNLSPQDIEDFKDLAATGFGLKQMDELAETSRYINQGGYPTMASATDVPGVADAIMPANPKTVFGDFVDVAQGEANFGLFWFRNIQGVIDNDGVIGKLAVANLEQPSMARRAVADAIRADKKFGYTEKFSALYTGELTIDEFAARYVDDVLHMFSDSSGKINNGLLNKVAPVGDDGWRKVSLYDELDGEKTLRLTPQTINAYRKSGAPDYVLGQQSIPMPQDDTALLDKAWGWMGEQYARIAREPVFLANYKEQRGILRQYEKSLADAIGPVAAKAQTARMASDRAYGFTLSYVDNPENRSQMAWKIRNVSRYYRATEDFYRRMFRMAKNYPEGFWKTALTYQVLDDTGYIFTDDQGDKYFAYPGNEMLQAVVKTVMAPLTGSADMAIDPFFMGGKVKMMAPSSDPNQAFPQAMGPIAVLSGKFIFDKFPQIQGLERYITGEYAQNQSWYEVFLPAAVTRAMNGLSEDERQSMYGNAVMDAFAIATASGLVPETTADGVPIETYDQMRMTPQWEAIQRIAWAGVATKMLLGYAVPASPQMYVDNVTDYARAHGITSMRGAFLDLVKQHSTDPNPMSAAFVDWWTMNPDGDLMPFTVSKTENTPGLVNQLADVQAVNGLRLWYKDNKALYQKYPNAALFLAPRDGEFSWGSWSLITSTLGLKIGKDFKEFMQDAMSSTSQAAHYATYDDYQKDIDRLDPNNPNDAKQITYLTKQRSADLKKIQQDDPWWAAKYASSHNWEQQDNNAQAAYNQTKIMVDDLKSRGADTPASRAIRSAIYTYEDYMSDIKAITGTTNAEDSQKRLWRQQLAADLEAIGGEDANAKVFIQNVLYRTPDMAGDR